MNNNIITKEMKDKINKVVDDLDQGNIRKKDAETILLGLYSVSNRSLCSRCGRKLSERWEQSVSNFTLDINIDCQSTEALWGEGENIGYEHPAIERGSGNQKLKIASGEDKDYRLCVSCHRKFTRMIGDWLRNEI